MKLQAPVTSRMVARIEQFVSAESESPPPVPTVDCTDGQGARGVRQHLATSDHPAARLARGLHLAITSFSLPAPRAVVRPVLLVYLALRSCYYFLVRVTLCEPLFKAYCTRYGRNLRTGSLLHWVKGAGEIIIGDNVRIDGRCNFTFAARFSARPQLIIGDNTGIGHNCEFVVGKSIVIGRNCTLSGDVTVRDSNGHSSDPVARIERRPPSAEDVRPVVIQDNVWIAKGCIIFPGVRIGQGSVVSAGSVVRSHIPPFSVVAGNPAKVVFRLPRESRSTDQAAD